MPRVSIPPAGSLLFSQGWGAWWGDSRGESAVLLCWADLSPGEDGSGCPALPMVGSEELPRQLWRAQTMPTHPREGLLLLDEMKRSQRRNPLLASRPCIQGHPAGSQSHSLNENDKFTRKGWLPSTSKGSALWASGPPGTAPLSVGPAEPTTRHRPGSNLLSQNVWAHGLDMCVFKSFLGDHLSV